VLSDASCADHDTSRCLVHIWSTGTDMELDFRSVRDRVWVVRHPEKRKVDSSILSLTAGSDQVLQPVTCENVMFRGHPAAAVHARLRPLMTAARHRMLHVDCTTHGSGGSRLTVSLPACITVRVDGWSTPGPQGTWRPWCAARTLACLPLEEKKIFSWSS
jgi:hypothetical protein